MRSSDYCPDPCLALRNHWINYRQDKDSHPETLLCKPLSKRAFANHNRCYGRFTVPSVEAELFEFSLDVLCILPQPFDELSVFPNEAYCSNTSRDSRRRV